MSTYSTKPNVRVTVNNIPSVCNGDCTYTFLTTIPILLSASIKNMNQLGLSINNPTNNTIMLSDLAIELDGQPCINLVGSLSSFTCDLPKNTDNTPIISAGDHLPVVKVNRLGLIDIDSSVNPISVDLTATPSITSGGNNGGYTLTLTGTGYPSEKSEITFELCDQTATIITLTNIKA